jgi:rhodanese-related sulfurtransferase
MNVTTIIFILLAIVLVLIIGFLLIRQISRQRYKNVTGVVNLDAAEFQKEVANLNGKILIDVREVAEVQQGYIPGATHIPVGELANRLDEVPKDKQVLLYCRGGVRSGKAGKMLLENGYTRLAHLAGGINVWTGPVKKD